MKLIVTLVVCFVICSSAFGQLFNGFFDPVEEVAMVRMRGDSITGSNSVFLMRPNTGISPILIVFEKDGVSTYGLNTAGVGISYGKYKATKNGVYCKYSVNAMVFTKFEVFEKIDSKLGVGVTFGCIDRAIEIGPVLFFDKGKPLFGIVFSITKLKFN